MGEKCFNSLKYQVMIINLIYMLLGLFLLGTMLYLYWVVAPDAKDAKDVDGYNWIIIVLMAIGTIMVFVGFLGCCGAVVESQCMLAIFFALVLVLFAGQVVVCTLFYSNPEELREVVMTLSRAVFVKYYEKNVVTTKAIDIMQKELRCCGVDGPADWKIIEHFHRSKTEKTEKTETNFWDIVISGIKIGLAAIDAYEIPASCCHVSLANAACEDIRHLKVLESLPDSIYTEGCADKVLKLILSPHWLLVIILLVLAFVEVLAMIFSMVLCCTARRIDQYNA